jgi:hypothetical protein
MPVRIIESGRTRSDWAADFKEDPTRLQGQDDIAAKLSVVTPDFYVHRIEHISIPRSLTDGRVSHVSDNSATSHARAIRRDVEIIEQL